MDLDCSDRLEEIARKCVHSKVLSEAMVAEEVGVAQEEQEEAYTGGHVITNYKYCPRKLVGMVQTSRLP